MTQSLRAGVEGTIVLWAVSATLASALALGLAAASLSSRPVVRFAAQSLVNVSRGIPTSLLVVAAGLATIRLPSRDLPVVFPGTPPPFQQIAWALAVALAVGSAGHLAMIFRASRAALGRSRLEQAAALGLSRARRLTLLVRESASIALAPTGARLVHHLHNTAFAALFPVTDVFGVVQGQANATFRVVHFALVGCAVYVALSALIWLVFRGLEAVLVRGVSRPPRARAILA